MHVAIDDTFGPTGVSPSRYVTGARRTYVAIEFPDDEVEDARANVIAVLAEANAEFGTNVRRLHFSNLLGKWKEWRNVPGVANLRIFERFAELYRRHRWRVHVQTVDDRTMRDLGVSAFRGKIDGLDLSRRDDLALFILVTRSLLPSLLRHDGAICVVVDQGRQKAGRAFAPNLIGRRLPAYVGRYAAAVDEPLLQIADFMAFSINRCTYLPLKAERSATDLWFLELVATMGVNSPDIMVASVAEDFDVATFDQMHAIDRALKGLR